MSTPAVSIVSDDYHASRMTSVSSDTTLPNIHFAPYNDLLSDTESEIQRVADFLGIPVAADFVRQIRESTHIETMRADSEHLKPNANQYHDGSRVFFHKGSNGRWRGVLTDTDLALYEAVQAL